MNPMIPAAKLRFGGKTRQSSRLCAAIRHACAGFVFLF